MRREISYKVLDKVLNDDLHAHLVLKDLNLDPADQAFVSALVYTVLQNKMYLEYQLEDLIQRKPNKKVQLVLLMAAAQLFKMDEIPNYALVNEYVELTKKIQEPHAAGFVNALLKKLVAREKRPLDLSTLEGASIYYSMPLWILNLLKSQYSMQFAIDYAKYVQSVKPIYAWVNALKKGDVPKDIFDANNPKIVSSDIFRTQLLDEAKVVIQDINSQEVVESLPIKKGMHVLDCCCAPGTKTLGIANKLMNTGRITAVDVVERRVKVTEDLMLRAGVENASIILADAQTVQFEESFDLALIDAPCSGLGVLSHKHDLRYHIQPSDLDDLQKLQSNILDNIAQYVKVEGLLVYATCTLNKKENEKQVASFLKRHPNYELVYEKTFDPLETSGDGFYVAHCLKKW